MSIVDGEHFTEAEVHEEIKQLDIALREVHFALAAAIVSAGGEIVVDRRILVALDRHAKTKVATSALDGSMTLTVQGRQT